MGLYSLSGSRCSSLGEADLGDLGLESHDLGGRARRVGPADQAKQLGDIGLVQRLLGGEVRLHIVVTIGQAEPRLGQVHRIVLGVLLVGVDADIDQGGEEAVVLAAHQGGQGGAVRGGAHRVEIMRQRRGAKRLYPRLVHEGAIEGADLFRRSGGLDRSVGGGLLQDRVHPRFRQLRQHGEGAVAGAVRRDDNVRDGRAVGEAKEVVPRLDRPAFACDVEAPDAVVRGRRHGHCRRGLGARAALPKTRKRRPGDEQTQLLHQALLRITGLIHRPSPQITPINFLS